MISPTQQAHSADEKLLKQQYTWLITGVAGFIGSNLLETLLQLNQKVVGLDDLSTGKLQNLAEVEGLVGDKWANFMFIEGDICDLQTCQQACQQVDFVLHEAALGSVPRSLKDPIATHAANLTGFLNMLVAARDNQVKRFIYAASSSTYGDHPGLPKVEDAIGKPLSPYALTKYANELYADIFARCYQMQCIGLRYFNVFGARQDPEGAYAAVIPKWIAAMINGETVQIYGDGETSRDFCYVKNVIQANLLAAMTENENSVNQVFNVAVGQRTTLSQLYAGIKELLRNDYPALVENEPAYGEFREGDVRHSLADISKAKNLLGYQPTHTLAQGLRDSIGWYLNK